MRGGMPRSVVYYWPELRSIVNQALALTRILQLPSCPEVYPAALRAIGPASHPQPHSCRRPSTPVPIGGDRPRHQRYSPQPMRPSLRMARLGGWRRPRTALQHRPLNEAFPTSFTRIAALPEGRRQPPCLSRRGYSRREFAGRMLPFGTAATLRYPGVVLARRLAGAPIEGFDALIAATALAAGASVATCDIGGFSGCGLGLVDPWTAK